MVAAHSTGGGWLRPAAWLGAILLPVLLAAAQAAAAPAADFAAVGQPGARWRQVENRIDSGYFQQDAAGLRVLATRLSAQGSAAPADTRGDSRDEEWRNYYAALLAYRLALLAKGNEARAWPFTQQCVDSLNRTLALDTTSAEALSLQSACLALQSSLDPWRSPMAAALSQARIDKALKLAPDNPRVLLLGALGAGERPTFFGGDNQQAFALMRRSVSAFERERAAAAGLPRWGAADAFTDLARDYLGVGDALAARNVLERALLIAPEFAPARRLMAEIVSG